jgi:ParB-like chromosome segregation protein Spo0J
MKIELVQVDVLSFDPNNARKHSDENLQAIAGSLERFGQRKPIVVTVDNVVVAGNGTLEAARSLGWSKIDVVRVPADWSADEVKAFALADNRTAELAEWDKDVLAVQLLDLEQVGFSVSALGFEPTAVAEFEPIGLDENPALDERVKHECPHCGETFEMANGKPRAHE